ncbi:amidohydrolase family protein [Streptomyces sp. NBC_00847]|uniref:amidohydrolase family protein n=1 Tax=unclassified Streptomyces TaxID=2593676 RepID=UPI0022546124|nr:amidohydrolase family protein [Streptomyces sp. NBC_00847]MCX4878631.1 amidohydrolase [Streptomyces sp. NBC_00847]
MTVIDVHAHVFPRISRTDARVLRDHDGPWLRDHGDGTGMMMAGDTEYRPVTAALWDPAARVAEMDALDVDIQVVSSTPLMFGYDADVARAAAWCDYVNQQMLDYCAQAPNRLVPLCQVPLQDTEAACESVTRAVRAGHRGVHIGNHVGPRDLDHGAVTEFLTHCAIEGATVLVHPWDMAHDPRTEEYMLAWLVGMSAETHLSILRLALSGAFERIPRELKLLFAHGGGAFPYLLGRADNAWRRRDIVRKDSPLPPSGYLDRFHVDSAVFDQHSLRLLVDVMGTDRVLLGTDYPFPLGEAEPGALIRASRLNPTGQNALLAGNAVRLFGLQDLLPTTLQTTPALSTTEVSR